MRQAAYWVKPAFSPEEKRRLGEALKIEPLVAAILINRGYADAGEAHDFLRPKLKKLHDPFCMRDMATAVERINRAISRQESILLYGDYDVDGTCSVVVLKKTIEILGGSCNFHIPDRLKDGYGMKQEIIDHAVRDGVGLVISVDTGIRASEVVRYANQCGIDVIVTDHHLPEDELPPALAVLNPNRRDCAYPNKNLCGAGVTFKLVQALLGRSQLPEQRRTALLDSFLKPVAIATVADIVPLTEENRVIVKRGLSGLKESRNPGLKALMAVAGFTEGESPSAHQVAFRLAPRINAAGRMATAHDVIELFLTTNVSRAEQLAEQLDLLNRERQRVEAEIVQKVLDQCEMRDSVANRSALVFAGEGWHLGVLGIVASRLVERFYRPVFVLSEANGVDEEGQPYLSGSGRSIPGFHLLEALENMPELFTKFGGHRQAAGLSLRARDVDEFERRFNAFAEGRLSSDDLRPRLLVDAEASFTEFTDHCIEQILSIGPFGFGNPTPLLYCPGVEVAGPPKGMASGKHFTVALKEGRRTLFCKAWNLGERADALVAGSMVDVLLQIEDDPLSRKRGFGGWCLSIKDFRPAEN